MQRMQSLGCLRQARGGGSLRQVRGGRRGARRGWGGEGAEHTEGCNRGERSDNSRVTHADRARNEGNSWSFILSSVPIRLVFASVRTSNAVQFPNESGMVPLHDSTLSTVVTCSKPKTHQAFA